MVRWREGLSVGLGTPSTADEGIPDGGQASLHPITAVQGLPMPLPAAVHENSIESMRS